MYKCHELRSREGLSTPFNLWREYSLSRIFTDLIMHNYWLNQSALMTRFGTDLRHQYGIFGGKSQTSFMRNATRAGSEEGRLFSQAMIGWDRGHFSLIKRAWLLDADWLSTPALNWFPASNGVWKGISENASLLSLILTRSHLNVKENQHATKRSHLVEKQKDFSDQKRIHLQHENSLIGGGWCRMKH